MGKNDSDAYTLLNDAQQRQIERLNEQLRQQSAEYDMLMESAGVCIVKVRAEAGFPVEWCNRAAYRAIGYTKEEYEVRFGHDVRAYFNGCEESLKTLESAAEEALRSGKPEFHALVRLPSEKDCFQAQCTGRFTDFDAETGRYECVCIVFTDVTAAAEARERLAQADSENARLAAMIDNIPAGISAMTIEDGMPANITVNRYLAQHLGIRSGRYEIRDADQVLRFVHTEDREKCKRDLCRFLTEKGRLDVILRIRNNASHSFPWIHVEGRIAGDSNGAEAAFLVYTDISELKNSEKTLREAVVSARLIVWEYDIRSHTIFMADNETTDDECQRFGFSHVITGVPESLASVVDEHSMPALLDMYRKVEAGENASCEIWYKRRPGWEPHCERVSYTVERDEEGRAFRAYAVGADITAEKNAEERYTRERSYLQDNRDFNLISKGRYNLTQNKVLEYSMQAEKTPGGNYFDTYADISYDEAAAALFEMPCPEEDHKALIEAVDRQYLLRKYQEGHFVSRAQYRRLQKGDLPLWMSVEMRTFRSPFTGDVECFSYTYDITDKVRNEEIMNRIAATKFDYVALIFEGSGTFEFLQKSEKILFPEVRVRASYAECFDYVRSNFVADEELAQYDAAVALNNILEGLKDNVHWSSTYRRTENGTVFCKQLDYSWFDREEGVILVVRTDISASYERDQKQLSEMHQAKLESDRANEAKSAFLSSMSHDMRTPLNAVLGFTDLALREDDETVKQNYLEKIKFSGDLLLDLVNETLELSRIESGKLLLEPEAVYGSEIWESVITSLRPAADKKNITLVTEQPDDLEETLWVDRLKLQKILLNLISNSIKYTPAGGTVRISVKRIEPAVNECTRRITVEDNGIGISPEFLPEVFEPFAQEHRAEVGSVTGTGLGLAIVKRIVDLMGGTIEVQSRLSQGTCFIVDLPVITMETERVRSQNKSDITAFLAGKKILLCEDNDLNAEIVTILLKEKGMDVERAADGSQGLERFSVSAPDNYSAILMDIRMPVMDGYTATKRIRGLCRTDAKTIPIIAMTADAFEEDARRVQQTGMDGYLPKPVDPEKLFRMLAAVIREEGTADD